jgi:Mrp family chromosome partitioning ATPase
MLINKGLNPNYGARNGVPQIAVFVTDGHSTRKRLTALAIDALKETDINIFAIGM